MESAVPDQDSKRKILLKILLAAPIIVKKIRSALSIFGSCLWTVTFVPTDAQAQIEQARATAGLVRRIY